ncbi:hypothetical protein KEM60_01683 [Austwickia sp. TVS 96-490-7B]|uniref:FAD-binding oxidoreductase n=1 Tax=Austwickia sp. TVS 96-490-7B TaxID=2830843 RepID=UPI001DFB3DFC|nr:FAD-binding oxidoreductase [Austwickia sp. TVS 96-490-7B]MBW3085483.1 hypothetical protein [Austwickia sp. TVS 96-490-7B]
MGHAMEDALTRSIPRSVWHGWGDPTEMKPLRPDAWSYLTSRLGVQPLSTPRRPVQIDAVRVPTRRVDDEAIAELRTVVGHDLVRDDHDTRVRHAGGKSYPDMMRMWLGDGQEAPDAVVLPGTTDEIVQVLQICARRRIAVVPFGGGTSVVGGVAGTTGTDATSAGASGFTGVISLDLRRLDRMVSCDQLSRTAVFQAGVRGPDIERALRPYGLTLGHYPQSHQEATFGGYLATRSAGQASTGYGRVDQQVIGVRMATPTGELVVGGRSPASAAGPRLHDMVLGSEGTLGVISEATVRVQPMPTHKRYAAWLFGSFAAGSAALRQLSQELGHGWIADVARLSDEDESEVTFMHAGPVGKALLRYAGMRGLARPCLLILVWEGTDDQILKARQNACTPVLRQAGGIAAPSMIAKAWEKHRFSGPYQRDYLMGHRILADTLETATTWGNLADLHDRVGAAIRDALTAKGGRCLVMCHVSHVYPAGASLYYTFAAPEEQDPIAQWAAVKAAACEAISAGGGTITHHHAVGRDHRPYLAEELGDLGVRALHAVKRELDPAGIMNPGKLLPALPGAHRVADPTSDPGQLS